MRGLSSDVSEFIRCMNSSGVEFAIVGAWALAFYGHPRWTGDVDVLVKPDASNAKRLLHALEAFGFSSLELTEDDFTKPGHIIQLGRAPNRIDILTGIDGVSTDAALQNAVEGTLGGLPVRFLGFDELIQNKRASGRSQDLTDAEKLESLRKANGGLANPNA